MSEERKEYNAGDAQQVAKAQSKAKIREHLKKSGLRKLMSDPESRVWMWDLLILCGFSRSSFSHDALTMAFNEGMRQVGLQLVAEINRLDPNLYVKMALENTVREKE
jgi:hypothetical protein